MTFKEEMEHKVKSRNMIYDLTVNSESVVLEVGVWEGDNAELIYNHNPKEMYLIDAWANQSGDKLYRLEKGQLPQHIFDNSFNMVKAKFNNKDNVKIIKGFSMDLVKNYEDEFFDMIYIDAAHYYEAVKNDFENWLPKVKVGGYICGDDYIVKEKHKFGVIPAIDEFVEKHDVEIVYFDEEKTFPLPGHGQFCLKKVGKK